MVEYNLFEEQWHVWQNPLQICLIFNCGSDFLYSLCAHIERETRYEFQNTTWQVWALTLVFVYASKGKLYCLA